MAVNSGNSRGSYTPIVSGNPSLPGSVAITKKDESGVITGVEYVPAAFANTGEKTATTDAVNLLKEYGLYVAVGLFILLQLIKQK